MHPSRLLDDLRRLLRRLEADLHERVGMVAELHEALQREYRAAREAGRTGEAFEVWREGVLTQAAAAWLLGCVFVRFLEDNGLVQEALLSGPDERRRLAAERQMQYFQQHPTDTDRDYLYEVFRTVATLPAVTTLFDPQHNPVWAYGISGDAARDLIAFWRQVVPETGALVHDFTDATWDTRFLGDLYQDLSEDARKRYALLQTPIFVEEFILDRTLDPAIEVFGLKEVRLIDPTCGSGHFLLGAFQRLLRRWFRAEPGTPERELVQRALDAVYGVDVNPYAIAIARFRLLVAALKASGIRKLREAPGFRLHLAVGDSLLHGRRFDELGLQGETVRLRGVEGSQHVYRAEDLAELNRILGQQYHAVVGNPPYITVKDAALNQAYRSRFSRTCHRQYSLAVPFTERFFELAIPGYGAQPAGYVGMITANSFMKREFGKKLIEEFFPRIDLTHVIDTSGAYIPGHGTPTVILFGRHRTPVAREVRAVLGIRGEPGTPDNPSQGLVWRSIVEHLDQSGSQNEFVSVTNLPREMFARHPWSIGGGGAAELKQAIEDVSSAILDQLIESIGRTTVVGEDDCWILDANAAHRLKVHDHCLPFGIGECIRDWSAFELPV
ncbi:MAG TPA: BREX-2 system adenine-specific DNA-methyltransferase PglX, partial [Candidatus Tectomicrobia bacterium]